MKIARISFSLFAVFYCMSFFCIPASAQESSGKTSRPRVALVLEGGAALGFAHIGVIKVIEELGIPIDIVVGTSIGATIGGFYALGYDAAFLEEIVFSIDWDDIFSEKVVSSEEQYRSRLDRSRYFGSIDFDRQGFYIQGSLISGRKMLYTLDRMTISQPSPVDFDSLPRRFRAVTADISKGERVVIDHGSLADAMRASMGIPGIFAPYRMENRYLVDGGIIDNLPVGTARDIGADLIIAVDLLGGGIIDIENSNGDPMDAVMKTVEIMLRSSVQQQLLEADLVLTVDLSGYQAIDFKKAAEIIALGEKTARNQCSELEAFKARLGVLLPGEADVHCRTQSPIQRVIVEGGEEKDRQIVAALFESIVGTIPDDAFLEDTLAVLEAKGLYESIRIQRTGDEPDSVFLVTLKKREELKNSLRLGIEYASTYSGSAVSTLGLSPGVVFRGLTTDDSQFTLNIQVFDSPAFEASFVQPIAINLFIEGYINARQDAEIYMSDSTLLYLYQTSTLDFGINLGMNPVNWVEISAGLSYGWIQSETVPDIRTGRVMDSALMAHSLFSIRRFDSPIFPVEGWSIKIRYDRSLIEEGTSRIFHTLGMEGLVMPPLKIPFSFALWWIAGSDFSEYADETMAAPLYYKPDLENRQFFPGPLEVREHIGSHVFGIGGEFKFQFNWASNTIGFPSFILAQMAAGSVLQDIADIGEASAFTHLDSALGIGVRFNDGFGVLFRIGLSHGFNHDFRPFVALDLGSLGA